MQLWTLGACKDLENHWVHLLNSQKDLGNFAYFLKLCFPQLPFKNLIVVIIKKERKENVLYETTKKTTKNKEIKTIS